MKELSTKAHATREKILRAADELFYTHGYTATGVDKIIAHAGVTKGNFFHHFKNKEALALEVIAWHRARVLEEIGFTRILALESPLQSLLALVRALSAQMVTEGEGCTVRGCFFGNFALEMSIASDAVRRRVHEVFTAYRALLQQLIEGGQAAGEIAQGLDAAQSAGMILALLEGAVLLDKAGQQSREVREAVRFIEAYLKG